VATLTAKFGPFAVLEPALRAFHFMVSIFYK
jgi:hypothetical protein